MVADPIVYEDFLPRSAAGIFASNLTDGGRVDADQGGAPRDVGWMSDVIGRQVNLPEDVYLRESLASLSWIEIAGETPLGLTRRRSCEGRFRRASTTPVTTSANAAIGCLNSTSRG